MPLADDRLRRTAFHAAGHAWMLREEGVGVASLSLENPRPSSGDDRGLASAGTALPEGRPDLSLRHARAALAGSAAEHFLLGKWDEESLQARAYDAGKAKSCLVLSGQDWKPEALEFTVHFLTNRVLEVISHPRAWHGITALAYALLERRTMTGEEVERFLEETR